MSGWKTVKLFIAGVFLGVGLFLLGGVAVVPAHSPPQSIAQLEPWLLKTMCEYPSVDCTSRGPVVTSPPAVPRTLARVDR